MHRTAARATLSTRIIVTAGHVICIAMDQGPEQVPARFVVGVSLNGTVAAVMPPSG